MAISIGARAVERSTNPTLPLGRRMAVVLRQTLHHRLELAELLRKAIETRVDPTFLSAGISGRHLLARGPGDEGGGDRGGNDGDEGSPSSITSEATILPAAPVGVTSP